MVCAYERGDAVSSAIPICNIRFVPSLLTFTSMPLTLELQGRRKPGADALASTCTRVRST